MINIKRAYTPPTADDGRRFLVDRLWPRGITQAALRLHAWLKDVAPSDNLRHWFGHRPACWDEFCYHYFAELDRKPEAWRPIVEAARHGNVTLLYSAGDTNHNNAVALLHYLATKV